MLATLTKHYFFNGPGNLPQEPPGSHKQRTVLGQQNAPDLRKAIRAAGTDSQCYSIPGAQEQQPASGRGRGEAEGLNPPWER